MNFSETRRRLRLQGYRLWLVGAVLAYTLFGFLLAPWLLHKLLEGRISDATGHRLAIESVRVNPFLFSVDVRGARLDVGEQQDALGFDRLVVDFQLSSAWNLAWTFGEIRLVRPHLDFVRHAEGNTLSALVPPGTDDGGAAAAVPALIVRKLAVEAARIGIVDRTRPGGFETTIEPADLEIEDISTVPELSADGRLVAKTASGGRFEWSGEHALHPLAGEGRIEYRENLRVFWRYFRHRLDFDFAGGSSELELDYRFDFTGDEPSLTVSGLRLAVSDLATVPPEGGEPFLQLERAAIEDGFLAWPSRETRLGMLRIDAPRLRTALRASGELDLIDYLRPPLPAEPDPPGGQGESASLPWTIGVERLQLREGAFAFRDERPSPAFSSGLEDISIDARGIEIGSDEAADVTLDAAVSTGGTLQGEGTMTLDPFAAQLDVELGDLDLTAAQPYVQAAVRLALESGRFDASGRLEIGGERGVAWDGSAELRSLAASDRLSGERFVAAESARADRVGFSLSPLSLEVGQVDLESPYIRILIDEDGSTNVGTLLRDGGEDDAADAQREAVPVKVFIGGISVEAGTAAFADLSLPVPFSVGIYELAGSVGTVHTADSGPAAVDLRGRVDQYGSVRVGGELDVISPASLLDLDVAFRNVPMSSLSPYVAKFAGRRIEGGRLDLDLDYRIDDGRLEASNDVVIESLELGERVESPDAIDVPLGLAIALLEDSQGRITVDIPVSGNLGNPQFSLGGVIGKAIRNLLVGIVTSPFRLLASLVGGSPDELDHVDFEAGSSELAPPEEETLSQIARAMSERPQLVLRLSPSYAPERDLAALRKLELERAIEAQLESLPAGDGEALPRVLRRTRALEALYAARHSETQLQNLKAAFTAQASETGEAVPAQNFDGDDYLAALRSGLLETVSVGQDDLEALARERGEAVRTFLVDSRDVDPGRVAAEAVSAVRGDGPVRVEFELASRR